MDGERSRKYIIKLHLQLKTHGYVLDGSDIERCCPLGSQARGHSKMPIVVTYRDSDTTQNVTQAAKEAGLWNQRKSKEDDKFMGSKGYFKASFPRRDTNQNDQGNQTQNCAVGIDQRKRQIQSGVKAETKSCLAQPSQLE